MRGKLVFSLVLSAVILTGSHLAWALSYTFQPLPDFPGASQTEATGINASGAIVGTVVVGPAGSEALHGVLTTNNGVTYTPIDDPASPPGTTVAQGINGGGQVVGFSGLNRNVSGNQPLRGYLLSGGLFSPVLVPGATTTVPSGINDTATIVGSFNAGLNAHGFFDVANAFTIFDVPGAKNTLPFGINNLNRIVGSYGPVTGDESGFFFDGSHFFRLDIAGVPRKEASGINDTDQIVGSFCPLGFCSITDGHGFLFSGGSFFQLDVPGSIATFVLGINDAGDIVGGFTDAQDIVHAFLATPTLPGQAGTDLPLISGSLTPVPEPSTFVLVGIGFLAAAAWRRRRR